VCGPSFQRRPVQENRFPISEPKGFFKTLATPGFKPSAKSSAQVRRLQRL
jgi:hypothetical protein